MSDHEARRESKTPQNKPHKPPERESTPPHATGMQRAIDAIRRTGNQAAAALLERLGGGRPLQESIRHRLEAALGEDLGSVRVVEGAEAQAAAHALNATAFTAGDTIVMGNSSQTGADGERLIAHEAAHVLQQRHGSPQSAVSQPGDASERAAARTADAVVAGQETATSVGQTSHGQSVAAVQRQYMGDKLSREQARGRITTYLESVHARQGGQAIRVTPDIKAMISRIFTGDVQTILKLDAYFARTTFPGTPAGLAADIVKYFPEFIDQSRLAHLGASSGPGPTKLDKVKDAVEKTAPYESPENQEAKWKFDREGKDLRKGEGTIGPYGVDLARIYNLGRELGETKPAAEAGTQARAYGSVDNAVGTIKPDALMPAEAKGKPNASNFADAREVARGLARDLDVAQQKGHESIALRLGDDYNRVKDRHEIAAEVARIALLIRDALPHRASKVSKIELYYGNQIVRVISLAKKAE